MLGVRTQREALYMRPWCVTASHRKYYVEYLIEVKLELLTGNARIISRHPIKHAAYNCSFVFLSHRLAVKLVDTGYEFRENNCPRVTYW